MTDKISLDTDCKVNPNKKRGKPPFSTRYLENGPAMRLHTYTHGFKLNVLHNLSKGDILSLCNQLSTAFGPGNEFRPEPIGNGFLIWAQWPGKDAEGYKCMRLFADRDQSYRWPWIHQDVMEDWKENPDIVIPKGKYYTFLKAFHTAPMWTQDELKRVKECLELHPTKAGPIPSQKKLDFKRSHPYA